MTDWLVTAGISRRDAASYARSFASLKLNISDLEGTNSHVLAAFGISSRGHRIKILRCTSSGSQCTLPCQNGGTCELNKQIVHACSCREGYAGSSCQTDLCNPNPCQHGGLCTKGGSPRGFSCACAAGYEGETCETMINKCESSPCQNGATCRPVVNDYECSCLPTFHGKECHLSWITRPGYSNVKSRVQNNLARANGLSTKLKEVTRSQSSIQQEFGELKTDLRTVLQNIAVRRRLASQGWTKFRQNGCYYKHYSARKTASQARSFCKSSTVTGADLVMIRDGNEWDFLRRRFRRDYLIGATDRAQEGQWKWMDGSAMTFTKWNRGEPNNAGDEDCAMSYPSRSMEWNDMPCSHSHPFLCKFCFRSFF